MEDSKFHFIRLHNGFLWSAKTSLSAVRGLQLKNLVSEGGRAGWRWVDIVLSPNYLMQLSGS